MSYVCIVYTLYCSGCTCRYMPGTHTYNNNNNIIYVMWYSIIWFCVDDILSRNMRLNVSSLHVTVVGTVSTYVPCCFTISKINAFYTIHIYCKTIWHIFSDVCSCIVEHKLDSNNNNNIVSRVTSCVFINQLDVW